jgi:hypothetical protein
MTDESQLPRFVVREATRRATISEAIHRLLEIGLKAKGAKP